MSTLPNTPRIFGGNIVSTVNCGDIGKHIFASSPYEYYLCRSQGGETIVFDRLGSCTLYLLEKSRGSAVAVGGSGWSLETGDCLQVENGTARIEVGAGRVCLLVAGTVSPHPTRRGVSLCRAGDIYRVSKPWGHELWINGEHPCYAFKRIRIMAGTKTSLQYHRFKAETNVLFEGSARLHYSRGSQIPDATVSKEQIDTVRIDAVSSVQIPPRVLHRLEALTDLLLYEVSTPHLDDVVRVQDDARRPDGRVASEHGLP